MKLTKQKLENLIQEVMETHSRCFEALENYAKPEQSFFGAGVQQVMEHGSKMYKSFDGHTLDWAWLTSHIGPRLGSGYSREVYAIGDSNMVLKMAFPIELKEGIASNKYEVDAFNKFPTVFPRSYVYDKSPDGPEWLVIEKVHVVESGPEYAEVIDKTFPSLGRAAKLLAREGYRAVDPSWVFERILDIYSEDENGDYDLWMDLIVFHRRGKAVDEETRKKVADATWFIATNDENLMRFITICKNLNVHFDEIREGNVGTNEERNKLVLIDISKFEFLNKQPDQGVYEEYPVNTDHYDHSTKNIETDPDYANVRPGVWRKK
tara:strand:- start:265 stop:1227 length:963 start_codon:yes stop_codon:yes gene_type:complete